MSQLGTEFKVGLFTLLGVAAIAFAVFVLSPDLFEGDPQKTYKTVLKDASGILPKTHVKTNGVIVGKVKSIELLSNATEVIFEVGENVIIPKGSEIQVQTVGFLGDKFIDIVRPDDTSKGMIGAGQLVPRAKDSLSVNEVIQLVGEIGKDVKSVTERFSSVLGTDEGERTLRSIVEGLDRLVNDTSGLVSENRADLRDTISELKVFAQSLNDVLNSENKEKIDRILATFDESMVEVKGASKNINLISQKVESGEGTIGRLINDDKTLEELEGAIKDIRKVLSPVSKLQVAVDYHGEYRSGGTSQQYFNLNLIPRPDSYYVLGFTDRGSDRTRKKVDPDYPEWEYKDEKKGIRFNLQFAKRWKFLALRFGLFETTGGVASDLFFFGDRLKLSFEAFEFAEKDDDFRSLAHLKAYASVLFFDHIQVLAGIDDPTRYDPGTKTARKFNNNFFFGAGVRFNDDDLKALFGLASLASP